MSFVGAERDGAALPPTRPASPFSEPPLSPRAGPGSDASSTPSFFRVPSPAPSPAPPRLSQWLADLTPEQYARACAIATQLVREGSEYQLALDEPAVPPLPASEEPDEDEQERDRDDPEQDGDRDQRDADDRDDPDEQETDDSALGFLRPVDRGSLSPDHHPDFEAPPVLTPPATDHRVQSILSRGARTFVPPSARDHNQVTFSSRINSEIVENLSRVGLIERDAYVRSTYPIFAIPKRDGRVRVIYDLSDLTPHLATPDCRLPRALDILSLPGPQFGIKVDLRDGFFHLPLDPALRPFLGIEYEGVRYRWTVLPMGLATAPGIMQSVMRHITGLVTARFPDLRAYVYLDDFLFLSPNPDTLREVPSLLRAWGFRINEQKSRLVPVQRLTYLGLDLDLANLRLTVPSQLRDRVLDAIREVPDRSPLYAQRLAGYLNFLRPVARLPLQLVRDVLRQDVRLPQWVDSGLYLHHWEFDAIDYDTRFRKHDRWIASDATPTMIGIADESGALSVPIPGPVPIYIAELVGLILATWLAPPRSTVYGDNTGALVNARKGRFPPSWAPWISALFADHQVSYRYVPSRFNPADLPSRLWVGPTG